MRLILRCILGLCLGRKRGAAAAGARSIGIVEGEAAILQTLQKINLYAHQINRVRHIHHDFDARQFKFVVAFFLHIEAQNIGEARTAAALHADAQKMLARQILLLAYALNLAYRALRQTQGRSAYSRFHIVVRIWVDNFFIFLGAAPALGGRRYATGSLFAHTFAPMALGTA